MRKTFAGKNVSGLAGVGFGDDLAVEQILEFFSQNIAQIVFDFFNREAFHDMFGQVFAFLIVDAADDLLDQRQ